MNEIKAEGTRLEALVEKVEAHIRGTDQLPHETKQTYAPGRFASMARSEFQTGLMYLVRTVARPSSF